MSKTSGVKYGIESKQAPVIHRGPEYREAHREPACNVFFTDSKSGVSVQVKLRREITDWLETLSTEEVNKILRDAIEKTIDKTGIFDKSKFNEVRHS